MRTRLPPDVRRDVARDRSAAAETGAEYAISSSGYAMRPVSAHSVEAIHEDRVGRPVRRVGPRAGCARPTDSRHAPVFSSPTRPGHRPLKLLASSSGLSLPTTPSRVCGPYEPVHADADHRIVDGPELLDRLVRLREKPGDAVRRSPESLRARPRAGRWPPRRWAARARSASRARRRARRRRPSSACGRACAVPPPTGRCSRVRLRRPAASTTTSSSMRTPPSGASASTVAQSTSRASGFAAELVEQGGDEVDARLDREHLPHADVRRVAQERVVGARRPQRAAHVVRLQAQRVPEAVGIERARDAARDGLVGRAAHDADLAQDAAHLPVRLVVELLVRHAHLHRRAEPLLHRLDARDELSERGRRRARPFTHVRVMSAP